MGCRQHKEQCCCTLVYQNIYGGTSKRLNLSFKFSFLVLINLVVLCLWLTVLRFWAMKNTWKKYIRGLHFVAWGIQPKYHPWLLSYACPLHRILLARLFAWMVECQWAVSIRDIISTEFLSHHPTIYLLFLVRLELKLPFFVDLFVSSIVTWGFDFYNSQN